MEDGPRLSRLQVEQEHHAVRRGQAALGIVIKSRGQLDDVVIVALDISVLDVDVAGRILEDELADGRHDDLSPGIGGESVLDEGDGV